MFLGKIDKSKILYQNCHTNQFLFGSFVKYSISMKQTIGKSIHGKISTKEQVKNILNYFK